MKEKEPQPITNAIFHCRFCSDNKALSPQQRRCGTTEKQPAIGNANIAQTVMANKN
jgi:hypothetical protein